MDKKFENDFNVLYENNSTSNYLVLRTGIDKEIINYQAQMLLNNKINGLLSFNINYIGEGLNCFYNVTSKCSLASFMSRKHFSRNEFLITILNIINNIYQLKNYLLYDNNILLDENFIYVEPEGIDIYFVYLPFLECKNDIKAFFTKLIVKLAKFHDEDSDNYIQKILEVIKNDLFNLSNLKSLLENLLGEEVKQHSSNNLTIASNHIEDNELGVKSSIFKFDKTRTAKAVITRGNIRIPNSQTSINRDQKSLDLVIKAKGSIVENDKESVNLNKKFNLSSFVLFLLQPFLLITFIFAANSKLIKMSENPKITVVILLLIFLSIDILLVRMIKEKSKKTDEIISYKPLQFIVNQMKSGINIKNAELSRVVKDKIADRQPMVDENYHGETVILKKTKTIEKPYLKEKDGEEVVEIDKKSLLIGRMESFVDYVVNSSAVGKIHAEILDEGGDFYIMDCNSRNGTFLNDIRILPNTKNKVSNNDVLRFANKEFIFLFPVKLQRVVL